MKKIQIKLIKISTLITILFLNTGCFFSLFENKPEINLATSVQKNSSAINNTTVVPTTNIIPECSDEINSKDACKKSFIKTQSIQAQKSISNKGGEVHKLRSIQGKPITIVEQPTGYHFPEFKNKIIILEMFGKDCSYCIKKMPILNKLRRRYPNHLEIIALQVEGKMSTSQANALIRRYRIRYPIISGQTATNLQYHVKSTYGWTGILPFILVIKNGVTEFSYRGSVTYNEINKDIRSLLP